MFLSMKEHVKYKCRTAMWNLFRIKRVQHLLIREACHILVLVLVMSHLDCANIIFLNLLDCTISLL